MLNLVSINWGRFSVKYLFTAEYWIRFNHLMNKNFTILYFEEIISKIIEDLDQSNLLVDIDHKMMYYVNILCTTTLHRYADWKEYCYTFFFLLKFFLFKSLKIWRGFQHKKQRKNCILPKSENSKKEVSWGKVVRKLLFWKNQTKGGALMQQNLPKCDELGLLLNRRTKLRGSNTLPWLF